MNLFKKVYSIIKKYFARKKHKYITKLHYLNSELCKIEIEYMDNVYKIWHNALDKFLGCIAIFMSEYMQGNYDENKTFKALNNNND